MVPAAITAGHPGGMAKLGELVLARAATAEAEDGQ